MNCKEFENEFSAFLDGESGEAEAQSLQAHIDSCPDCKEKIETAGKVDNLLLKYPAPEPPAGFAGRVVRQAEGIPSGAGGSDDQPQPEARILRPSFFKMALGVAALLVLSLGVYFQFFLTSTETTEGGTVQVAEFTPEEEKALLENYDLIENWDLLTNPEVEMALNLSDEDFEELILSQYLEEEGLPEKNGEGGM